MKLKYPFPLDKLEIKLKRFPCLGECPVYSLVINGSGEVVYYGEYYVEKKGEHRGMVSPLDVLALFKYAVEIGFFEMDKLYEVKSSIFLDRKSMVNISGYQMTDLASCELSIKTGQQIKVVTDYLGAPRRLKSLENKIDKLAGTRKWVAGS